MDKVQTFQNKYRILKHNENQILNKLILVELQLDAQNSYLFTHNTFIKILYIFRAITLLIFRRRTS